MQLDIFDDGRDTQLRNDIAQALLRGDLPAARRARASLAAEFKGDACLPDAAVLIEHLEAAACAAASPTTALPVDALLARRQHLERALTPAAMSLFGREDAACWLQGRWRLLARQAAALPWQPEHAAVHPAALHLQAGDAAEAAAAVHTIASWRRIPQPLMWMAEARWMGQGTDAAWPLLAEALWLAPAAARALLVRWQAQRPERVAARLMAGFEAEVEPEDDHDWAWLPAWMLIDRPERAVLLTDAGSDAGGLAEKPPVQAFTLMMALLRLERAGRHHEVVAQRRQLRSLNERLFGLYMRTR